MSSYSDYANAVARIEENRGNAAAEAARQQGAIWGRTIGTIGQRIASIPQQAAELEKVKIAAEENERRSQLTAYELQAKQKDFGRDALLENYLTNLPPGEEPSAQQIMMIMPNQKGRDIVDGFSAFKAKPQTDQEKQATVEKIAKGILSLPEKDQAGIWQSAGRPKILSIGVPDDPALLPSDWNPQWAQMTVGGQAAATSGDYTLGPGQTRFKPGGTVEASVPAAERPASGAGNMNEIELIRAAGTGDPQAIKDLATYRAMHPPSQGGSGGGSGQTRLYNETDPREISAAIQRGDLPPDITQYGRAAQGAISTDLAKNRFNLSEARLDWEATKKHIATMNGAQQLRLNQAINALPEMLDNVDKLSKQWQGGRFPLLNSANLKLAKGGAFGAQAQTIANQLDAQIADVVADLGNVYMGGNSPTDHALELAGKSLKSEWSQKTLSDMVTLAKKNVQIRRNSINTTGVQGASAGNPYTPQAAPAAPKATHRYNPQTGKVEEIK